MIDLMLQNNCQKSFGLDSYRLACPVKAFNQNRGRTPDIRPKIGHAETAFIFRKLLFLRW